MERFINEQLLQIVRIYYRNSCSVKNVYRSLRPYYDRNKRPGESTIRDCCTLNHCPARVKCALKRILQQ